jgi:rhodanese-related sulfurtransferase
VNQPVIYLLLVLAAGYFIFRMALHARSAVSPQEADAAIRAGTAVLVDVREPDEWNDGVAEPAVLLPLSDLRGSRQSWAPFLQQARGKRLLVYCRSGARSGVAAALLKSEGFETGNIGGFGGWVAAGLPVRKP